MKNDLVSLHMSVTECAETEQFSDYPRIVFTACLTMCDVCGGNGNKEACDNLGNFDDLQDLPLWPSADTQKVTVQSHALHFPPVWAVMIEHMLFKLFSSGNYQNVELQRVGFCWKRWAHRKPKAYEGTVWFFLGTITLRIFPWFISPQ